MVSLKDIRKRNKAISLWYEVRSLHYLVNVVFSVIIEVLGEDSVTR